MDFQKRWGKSTFAREKNGRDREKEKNPKKIQKAGSKKDWKFKDPSGNARLPVDFARVREKNPPKK